MEVAQKGLFEVYGLWYCPSWYYGKAGIIFIFILLLIVLFYFFRKYRTGLKLNSEQVALQELHRLRSHTYVSEAALHDAYFKLTATIKNYLASRYNIVLHDKSDIQIVSLLHGNLSQNMISLLQEFFDRAFRIKFAYDAVSEQMLFEDIALLQHIVIETSKSAETTGKS